MSFKLLQTLIVSFVMAFSFVAPNVHASDEGEAKSIYCDDGSLCVPDGEAEPECD